MKNGVQDNNDNVTVVSPEDLDIKDETNIEITLEVSILINSRTNDSSRGIITFVLSLEHAPEGNVKSQFMGPIIGALQETLIKEEFLKVKELTGNMSLIASDDVSKITIEDIKVKENSNE